MNPASNLRWPFTSSRTPTPSCPSGSTSRPWSEDDNDHDKDNKLIDIFSKIVLFVPSCCIYFVGSQYFFEILCEANKINSSLCVNYVTYVILVTSNYIKL